MAQSRFYSPPANIMPGIMSLGGAMKDRFEKDTAAKEEKSNMSEAQRIIEEGTPEDLAVFSVKHPKIAQNIIAANKHKNETTQQSLVDSWKKILMEDADPAETYMEHGKVVNQEGGEIGRTLQQTQEAMQDPEKAKQDALMGLALYDTPSFNAIQSMKAGPKQNKPTANMQDWEKYTQLKKINPEQATLFASQVGIEESQDISAIDSFDDDDMNRMADEYSESGVYPFGGKNLKVINLNAKIKKRSLARQKEKGISDINTRYNRLDKQGMQKDINKQQTKFGSMKSFVRNIGKQVTKIEEVGARMKRFDTKFLNIPINKIVDAVGSADRAEFRLLVGELEEEVGKLASGATESVAQLSEGGREKWESIFDLNLSYSDMMRLVKESKKIGEMRVDSQREILAESRELIRKTPKGKQAAPAYQEGQTANGGKLIFSGGVWKDNI